MKTNDESTEAVAVLLIVAVIVGYLILRAALK